LKCHLQTHVQEILIVCPKLQWKLVKLKSLILWPPPARKMITHVLRKEFWLSKIPGTWNPLSLLASPNVSYRVIHWTQMDAFQTNKFTWLNDILAKRQWFLGFWDREVWYQTFNCYFINLVWPYSKFLYSMIPKIIVIQLWKCFKALKK
jgi:hypothetical protein